MADGPIQDILKEAVKPEDQQGMVQSVVPEVLEAQRKKGGITVEVPPPGGTGGGGDGGSSSGGSSSGGSSSGGSTSAPADSDAPLISAAKSVYMKLWGQAPPSNYVEQAIHSGMNIWEFEDHERHKPAFRKTKTYRDEGEGLAAILHQLGVA